MNIKLLTVTWSHSDSFEISKTSLYKSFKKFNPNIDIVHYHFNRGHYWQLEQEFAQKFGSESEYILYKIKLLIDKVRKMDCEYIIFCDANDVTCLKPVNYLLNVFDLDNFIIVGHEKNLWPTQEKKSTWPGYVDYKGYDLQNRKFLNSGMILAKKSKYVDMLQSMIDNVLCTNINTFSNDQGVFTYYYNMNCEPKIKLDYNNTFVVNTYSRSYDEYYMNNNLLVSKKSGVSPCFVHDNGWNHGSPKFREFFSLNKIYE